MANLFDQYEQAATRGTYRRPHNAVMPEPVSIKLIILLGKLMNMKQQLLCVPVDLCYET